MRDGSGGEQSGGGRHDGADRAQVEEAAGKSARVLLLEQHSINIGQHEAEQKGDGEVDQQGMDIDTQGFDTAQQAPATGFVTRQRFQQVIDHGNQAAPPMPTMHGGE